MNWLIWGAVGILGLLAVMMNLNRQKPYSTVTIWEYLNGSYVKHDTVYLAYIKNMRNKSGDKTIYWTEIMQPQNFLQNMLSFVAKPKTMLWRPISHKDTIVTKKGRRHLNLLWLGKNDFRIMKPNMTKYKYVPLTNGNFKQEMTRSLELEVMNDEDHYFLAEVYDQIEQIYKKKADLMEQIKPFIPIAIVALACILMVYTTSKNITEASANMEKTGEKVETFGDKFVNAINTYSGNQKVDDNTVKNERNP